MYITIQLYTLCLLNLLLSLFSIYGKTVILISIINHINYAKIPIGLR